MKFNNNRLKEVFHRSFIKNLMTPRCAAPEKNHDFLKGGWDLKI